LLIPEDVNLRNMEEKVPEPENKNHIDEQIKCCIHNIYTKCIFYNNLDEDKAKLIRFDNRVYGFLRS
jgi:hypothetical protein